MSTAKSDRSVSYAKFSLFNRLPDTTTWGLTPDGHFSHATGVRPHVVRFAFH